MTLENLKRLESHFRKLGKTKEADFYKAKAKKKEERHGKKSA